MTVFDSIKLKNMGLKCKLYIRDPSQILPKTHFIFLSFPFIPHIRYPNKILLRKKRKISVDFNSSPRLSRLRFKKKSWSPLLGFGRELAYLVCGLPNYKKKSYPESSDLHGAELKFEPLNCRIDDSDGAMHQPHNTISRFHS